MNPVKKGTTIIISKPFAFTLSSKYRTENCDHCFRSEKLLKCSGCNYVYYCDKNCQKIAWKSIHKFECKRLKKILPKILPDAARLLARIIITLEETKKGKEEEKFEEEYCWGNNWRTFEDLMSHKDKIGQDQEKMEHFECLCVVLKTFLGPEYFPSDFDLDQFFEIYGKVCINSFTISDINLNGRGLGIYLAASAIDHSCETNAQTVYDGTTLIIRTLNDFPDFEFSQLRILYVDPLQTADQRKEALKKQYYFVCDCPSCTKPALKYTAAACQNTLCKNLCNATDKQCSVCGQEFPPDFAETYAKVDKFFMENKKAIEEDGDWDLIQKCLKKQEGVFHRKNVHHIATLDSAFSAAISLGYWKDAEMYGQRTVEGYLEYCGKYFGRIGHMYLQLGKIQWYLEKVHEASISADRAKSILTVTHGEEHSIFKNHLNPLLFQIRMEKWQIK